MNKQLFNLMKLRYGKVTLIGVALILGIFLLSTIYIVGNWTSQRDYFESDEFITSYQSMPEAYGYWDMEQDKEIPYPSMKAYTDDQLKLFRDFNVYQYQELENDAEYDPDTSYTWKSYNPFNFSTLGFLFIGFLLFFLDLKTSFNTFLFSSGFSRKQLFTGKLLFVGGPLLTVFALGSLIQLGVLTASIPSEYLNSPIWVLVMSIINSLIFSVFFFAIGCFIGTLAGNLIFGPVTIIIFAYLLAGMPYGITQLYDTFYSFYDYHVWSSGSYAIDFASMFSTGLNKNAGNWVVLICCIMVAMLFVFLAYKGYQKISLEKNGQYLLVSQWRIPIFLAMGAFSSMISLCVSNPLLSYQYNHSYDADATLPNAIMGLSIQLIIIFTICWLVVYSSKIMQAINRRREKMGKLV